ncbi:uncharacterized protein LOC144466925 [Epinephelus lanceolatus]
MSYSTGTNDEVLRLIDLRVVNDNLFTGKRNTSKKAWIEIARLLDMRNRVTPVQVSKKWDNLKIQYKLCRLDMRSGEKPCQSVPLATSASFPPSLDEVEPHQCPRHPQRAQGCPHL